MKKTLIVALLFFGMASVAAGQDFGPTSTTDSYTEEVEARTPQYLANEVRKALAYDGFRQVLRTESAVFLQKPLVTNSGYIQNYDAATVWVRDASVRVHIWRKRSNSRSGFYRAWEMTEKEVTNYRNTLNNYFSQ
jgi:hypothetical protein